MNLLKSDMLRGVIFAKTGGGDITVRDADGVVLLIVGLQPGIHQGAKIAAFMTQGDVATLGKGLMTLVRAPKTSRNVHPEGTDVGANQDWKPERMSDFEKQMRHDMRKLQARSDVAERMLRTAQNNADNDVTADVVEDDVSPPEITEAPMTENVQAEENTPNTV